MKIKIRIISMLILGVVCSSMGSYAQSGRVITNEGVVYEANVNEALTKDELKKITEVYGDQTQEVVLNNPQFLKDLKSLLRNRLEIFQITDVSKQKDCKLLSEIPLNDDYNPNIKRIAFKDVQSFNPLMYRLDFFAKGTYLYRIDNTNYFIQVTSQYRQ